MALGHWKLRLKEADYAANLIVECKLHWNGAVKWLLWTSLNRRSTFSLRSGILRRPTPLGRSILPRNLQNGVRNPTDPAPGREFGVPVAVRIGCWNAGLLQLLEPADLRHCFEVPAPFSYWHVARVQLQLELQLELGPGPRWGVLKSCATCWKRDRSHRLNFTSRCRCGSSRSRSSLRRSSSHRK